MLRSLSPQQRNIIQKMKIMASGPITSWEIDGETVETVSDFIFLGFKITTDGDCSHEIKRCLLLGRKVMTNLASILKSRDIPLCFLRNLYAGQEATVKTGHGTIDWFQIGKDTCNLQTLSQSKSVATHHLPLSPSILLWSSSPSGSSSTAHSKSFFYVD